MKEPSFAMKLARAVIRRVPAGRTKLIKSAIRCLAAEGTEYFGEFHSPPIRFSARLGETIDNQLFFSGTFEPIFTSLFLDLLQPGGVLYDVGANLGYYSLLGWQRVGVTGSVVAFEPDPNSLARLRRNITLNNANIDVVDQAVSNAEGVARFHISHCGSENQGGGSLAGNGDSVVEVTTTTLDKFVQERKVSRIDVLKMDIEGAEALAIHGMQQLLQQSRVQFVLLEMHRDAASKLGASPEQIVESIVKHGYRAYRIRGSSVSGASKYRIVGQYRLAELINGDYGVSFAHYLFVSKQATLPINAAKRLLPIP